MARNTFVDAPHGATHVDVNHPRKPYLKFVEQPAGRGYWCVWVDDIYGTGDWLKLDLNWQYHCEYHKPTFIDLSS